MFRFPWGDFHSLNLGWFLQKFNELREDWATAEAGIDGALDAEIQKAEDALTDVFAARDAAAASASAANSSALNASQSSIASMDARDQSRAARDAAQQAARNAAASETAAGNSATAASNSAGAAATSATQAGNSATAAGNSATAAGQSATNAAASETAAGNSAAAAAASETAAGQSAANAEEAAENLESSTQQIATNTNDIAILKEALINSFPSRISPISTAKPSGGYAGIRWKYGLVTYTPENGLITGQTPYKNFTLPAGVYKLVVDVISNTLTAGSTNRMGYICAKVGNSYNPIMDLNTSTQIRKYELIFTVTEESTVQIITAITDSGYRGILTAFAYFDLAIPTSNLALALSN